MVNVQYDMKFCRILKALFTNIIYWNVLNDNYQFFFQKVHLLNLKHRHPTMSCIFVTIKIQCYKRYNIKDFYCVIFGPPQLVITQKNILDEGFEGGKRGREQWGLYQCWSIIYIFFLIARQVMIIIIIIIILGC